VGFALLSKSIYVGGAEKEKIITDSCVKQM